jgi:hypothetical protein
MAEEPTGNGVAPAGEPIHLPDPSYLPVLTALGITITLVGIVLSWFVVGIGGLITLIAIGRWIAAARRETAALPLDH